MNDPYIDVTGMARTLLNIFYEETFIDIFSSWNSSENTSRARNRGGSRAAATSKMEIFVIIVNG